MPGPGASTAKEVAKDKKQQTAPVKRVDPKEVETPKEKIRKRNSEPTLSRDVQSKEVLGDGGAGGESRDPPQKPPRVDPSVPAAGKAAAAKTKVVPPKAENTEVTPKTETTESATTPRTVKAVQECLQRSATMESQGSTPNPSPKLSTVAVPVDQQRVGEVQVTAPTKSSEKEKSSESESESSEDEEAEQNKEEQVRKKKEAHARYMRFSRSLTSISSKLLKVTVQVSMKSELLTYKKRTALRGKHVSLL